jgi:hypothetical protein
VDGRGERHSAGRAVGGLLPPFPGRTGRFGAVAEDHSENVDNLWALGGEIIRNLNETPSLRSKSIEDILGDRIDDEGGTLVYALESEELQQRSLDSTCKKFYLFRRQHHPR